MRTMLMELPEFDAKMRISLEEKNRELCDEVWDALPFTCVQEHGVVSGEMIYCWVPVLSLAPVNFKLTHNKSPVGVVNYSQGTGNKIIVKYGPCNEDLSAPVLGYVGVEHHGQLRQIGREVWFNYYNDKRIIKVIFSKAGEAAQ